MKSQSRRRPYKSTYGIVRPRTRPRPETTFPADQPDGRASKFSAWIAGIVASCLVAVVGFWVSQRGEDTIAKLRGDPALESLVTVDELSNFEMVFDKGPLSRGDYAKLRLSSGAKAVKVLHDLTEDYDGARAKYFKAQIVLTGGRDFLTVLDIAVRHRINRADPPRAWYLFKGLAQGGNPSAPIAVNLDLRNPLFEIADKPGIRYFATHTVTLTRNESFTFEVEFSASTGYHEFDLEATYLLDGKKEKTVITGPDNGVFKIAGVADRRVYGDERYIISPDGGTRMSAACEKFFKSRGC